MTRVFGYARVSTQAQTLDRQLDALRAYPCDEIFMEKMSGTRSSRPELTRLQERLRAGDTVVIESWSRLGRSLRDLMALTAWFTEHSVALVSLKEAFDTSTPQGRFVLTLFQAMADFERELIAQRVREGLQSARARGRKGGRPPKSPKAVDTALKLYRSRDHSVAEIVRLTGVSSATLYRYLRRAQ